MDIYADTVAAQAAFQLPQEPPPPRQVPESSPEPPAPAEGREHVSGEVLAEPEEVAEFDPAYRQPFVGLLYVGALTHRFTLFGHEFTIATPTQTERLQLGLVIQPYQGTVTGEIAYQTALVAAYLVDIDGQRLPEPVSSDPKETALHDRFRWVQHNLRRPVIDRVFEECLKLDAQVDRTLEAMGKVSG